MPCLATATSSKFSDTASARGELAIDRDGEDVWSPSCADATVEAITRNSAATAWTARTMAARMRKSFTARMGVLVLGPVAGRTPQGAHGLREGFWRLGRSFRVDACAARGRWNDDVERVRKRRPARLRLGQRHRDAARAAGRAAATHAGGRSAALVIR